MIVLYIERLFLVEVFFVYNEMNTVVKINHHFQFVGRLSQPAFFF